MASLCLSSLHSLLGAWLCVEKHMWTWPFDLYFSSLLLWPNEANAFFSSGPPQSAGGPKHQKHAPSQAALLQAAGGQRQGIAGVSPLAGSKAPTFGVRYGPSTSAVLDKQVKILWGLEVMTSMSELDEQTPVIQETPFSSRLPASTTLRHPQGFAKCHP